MDNNELIKKAIEAKDHAYCPYSKFRVGAALITVRDKKIFYGCNVENASYGLAICAERVAICKAVSEGYREFKEIAISSDIDCDYIAPCGACRQFISEFGLDWKVTLIKNAQDHKTFQVRDILPMAFENKMLSMTNTSTNGTSK